ncbi:hypothetical protein ACVWYN_003654 [Pedobacter sp. UYP24]
MKKYFFAALLCFCGMGQHLFAQKQLAPAYPLIVHDPYFSIWSNSDLLTDKPTTHWTGFNQPLMGTVKIDGTTYRVLGERPIVYKTLLPTTDEKGYEMRYTEAKPASGWNGENFEDANWKVGKAPFTDNNETAGTLWRSKEIWTRRTFELKDAVDMNALFLKINHDDYIEVYLNGELIYNCECWLNRMSYFSIAKLKGGLKNGRNVLAIHCQNVGGGSWLDAGLSQEQNPVKDKKIRTALQKKSEINATQTVYDFVCGGVNVKLTFTSPLLMDDLNLLSRPISYISYRLRSNDGKQHDAEVYFGASSSIAVNQANQAVSANQYRSGKQSILKAGTIEQPLLQKRGDDLRIDWGYVYVATDLKPGVSQSITPLTAGVIDRELMLNTNVVLGKVGREVKEQVFMLGYDDQYAIQYFGTNLKPFWKEANQETIEHQFALAGTQYTSILQRCRAFNQKLHSDAVLTGGEEYAKLCEMAYRQSIAGHKLVKSPQGDLLFLSKENFSNGSINTVDVTYPSAPLYLVYNPNLVKGMLNGIFYYSESGKWQKPFPAHDLGTFPLANGQTYGDDMPVEEAGNMIILTKAIARSEGNAAYARKHWKSLSTWAAYLEKEGFDPADQLCTEDFSGRLARNSNLSLKAIVALGCYASLADQLGENATAERYWKSAREMVPKWLKLADDGDHYSLAFEQKNTWSQKYNLVWDKLFKLNLFSKEVFAKEIKYYLTKQNEFGLPLDNRKTYTINYSVLWTAVLAADKPEFEKFVRPIYRYATETPLRVPLSDWSETTSAKSVGFQARSVVGGYFMKMLELKLKVGR